MRKPINKILKLIKSSLVRLESDTCITVSSYRNYSWREVVSDSINCSLNMETMKRSQYLDIFQNPSVVVQISLDSISTTSWILTIWISANLICGDIQNLEIFTESTTVKQHQNPKINSHINIQTQAPLFWTTQLVICLGFQI